MARKRFDTPRKRINYEYAKLIYRSMFDKWGVKLKSGVDYVHIEKIYKKIMNGELTPSNILRENKLLMNAKKSCVYCGALTGALEWEHIIPLAKGGPDSIDNLVLSCKSCNLSKGTKNIFDWYENDYEIPRIIIGKYFKILITEYKRIGKLDSLSSELGFELSRRNLSEVFQL